MSQVTGIYPEGGVEAEQEKASKKRENLFILGLKAVPDGFVREEKGIVKMMKGGADAFVGMLSGVGYAMGTAWSAACVAGNKIINRDEKADQNHENMINRAVKTKENVVKAGKGLGTFVVGTGMGLAGAFEAVGGIVATASGATLVAGAAQAIGDGIENASIARKVKKQQQAQAAESQPTEQQKTDPQQRTM